MMSQKTHCRTGVVQKIEGDNVYVLMHIHSACAACHAKSVCIPLQTKNELLKIKNSTNTVFSEGEKVLVEIEQKHGGKALRIGYLYPFIIFIILIILVHRITAHELIAAFSSFAGITLYYFFLYLFNKKKKIDRQFVFYIRKTDIFFL
jgi:sigma-E factor negative regulatory protein RseC